MLGVDTRRGPNDAVRRYPGALMALAFLLSLGGCPDPWCSPEVGLRVQDSSGSPVEGATVEVTGRCCHDMYEPRECTRTTNEQGEVQFILSGGAPCDFRVTKQGYVPLEHSVATECDGSFIDDVTLEANGGT